MTLHGIIKDLTVTKAFLEDSADDLEALGTSDEAHEDIAESVRRIGNALRLLEAIAGPEPEPKTPAAQASAEVLKTVVLDE